MNTRGLTFAQGLTRDHSDRELEFVWDAIGMWAETCLTDVSEYKLFLVMRNGVIEDTALLGESLRRVSELLPGSWTLETSAPVASSSGTPDRVVRLVGPRGAEVAYAVEAKRSGSLPAKLLPVVLRGVEQRAGLPVLFVSDYIGASLRVLLAEEGVSYADATGWVRIVSDDPLILLTGEGARRAPKDRESSAVSRMNGIAASRTIRALVSIDLPIGVRGLAIVAGVSPGSAAKLLTTLSAEGIVDRDEAGAVVAVRRRDLIRRWVQDYSFAKTNPMVAYFIAPRGLERAMTAVGDFDGGVALTGSAAARRLLPDGAVSVVPIRLLALYAADPAQVAGAMGLIEADPATANVVIAIPQDRDILDASRMTTAPAPLVLADLLTLPGRSDAEAHQLMDTLAVTDPAWAGAA